MKHYRISRFMILNLLWVIVPLSACVHPISIKPDLQKITDFYGYNHRIDAIAGFYISPEQKMQEVVLPAAGGESISFYPYNDIEEGYALMLSNVFDGVVNAPPPQVRVQHSGPIDYFISPVIQTSSLSTNIYSWWPTHFSVDLTTVVYDKNGVVIATPRVVGQGMKKPGDGFLESMRVPNAAMEDALRKMQTALRDSLPGKKMPSKPPRAEQTTIQRLIDLKKMFEQGLISENDYREKKKKILEEM